MYFELLYSTYIVRSRLATKFPPLFPAFFNRILYNDKTIKLIQHFFDHM